MSKSSNKSGLTKRILMGVAIALVLVYIVFLFITTNFMGNDNIVTEVAYRTTAYELIESKAIAVRDEETLTSSLSGAVVYEVSDGSKVTADGVIATAYSDKDDVAVIQQIEDLDERIDFLKNLSSSSANTNVGIDTVNSQIDEKLTALIASVNSQDFSAVSGVEDELLSSILRKQYITGDQGNIDSKISELESQRDTLKASAPSSVGTVKSGSSGTFISKVDGYENTFDIDKLDEITAEDIQNAQPEEVDSDTNIGKVMHGVNWYLLCPVTADEATGLTHADKNIVVRLPSVTDGDIPAKILHINKSSDSDKAVAVLQCSYMNSAISRLRYEDVEIVVNQYKGLKLSKSALHDDYVTYYEDDDSGNSVEKTALVQGVYTEYGVELVFKQVSILYASDSYIIVNESPESGVLYNGNTVSLYDKVVIEGGNLFNGKIIS